MRLLSLAFRAVALLALAASVAAHAQATSEPVATSANANYRLLMLLRDLLPQSTATSENGESLQLVAPPLAIVGASNPPSGFIQFEHVAGPTGDLFTARPELLLDQLKKIDQDIELSPPNLTSEQRNALNGARQLLYVGGVPVVKTKEYSSYLQFQEKYSELRKELSASTNSAERTNLQLEITNLEQDWESYGRRSQISQALDTVAKYSADQVKDLRVAWEKTLNPSGVGNYTSFWDAIADTSNWIAVTSTISPQQANGLQLQFDGPAERVSQTLASAGQILISFKYRVFRVPRSAFQHPFLRSPNWRNTKSYVLSNGTQQANSAELIPRIVTAVLLIKGVEIAFSSAETWKTVNQAIAKNANVSLSGLPIKIAGQSATFSLPKYISSPQPIVFAALTSRLPQIPNTNASDSWPAWWQR